MSKSFNDFNLQPKILAALERAGFESPMPIQEKAIPSARAEANYHLAEAYVSLGNREKAVNHLKMAVVQSPDGEWGKKSEEYLQILR